MSGTEGPAQKSSGKGGARGPSCPVCRKPVLPEHRPFCSERCRKVDLNRWLSETYRIPAAERPESGENQSESED